MKSNKNKTKNKKQRHPLKPLKKKNCFWNGKTWSQAPGAQPRSRTDEPGFISLYCFCICKSCSFPNRERYQMGVWVWKKEQKILRERERKVVPWRQSEQHSQGVELLCRRNLGLLHHSSLSLFDSLFFFLPKTPFEV